MNASTESAQRSMYGSLLHVGRHLQTSTIPHIYTKSYYSFQCLIAFWVTGANVQDRVDSYRTIGYGKR
jgi:hypothetical protein